MVDEPASAEPDHVGRDADDLRDTFTWLARHWRPEPVEAVDTLTDLPGRALAALFDVTSPVAGPGDPLPPLWHWLAFPSIHPQSELGDDGHPRDAALTPPIPRRRRMFGGGRLTMVDDLRVGETVVRHSEVIDRRVREGGSGPMLIVTVRHTFTVGGEIRAYEEQDLVYLSAAPARPGAPRQTTVPAQDLTTEQAAEHAGGVSLATTEVLLFRFSALTWNSHRIHYDQAYTTGVEGHPALVVHGPLLALLLLEFPRRIHPGRQIATFSFRARRPLYVGSVVEVHDRHLGDEQRSGSSDIGADASRELAGGLELVASSATTPEAMVGTIRWAP